MNMKNLFLFLLVSALASRLCAQTNEPARLALIAESPDASAALDVLTAQLSDNPKLQLLERNEIEKVYREQGLSAGNKDYLKLGQILGADGLLLMETAQEGTNQFLNVRLIAVKPGVVLAAEKFSWPVADLTEWSAAFASHLNPLLPKLAVLIKDAVPISVVNLRSAISSADAVEMERQLKLLTIQRLSREPQFFVLERQKMQLLAEEKDLKLDDSAFWNGSYLLEGVVDQNGYSTETVTINARLTPPKGGAPLQFEVSGSRTNLAEVINQLAAKVDEALKVSSTVKEWNATDEAAQYFDEAKWAMRWGVWKEAQATADSAWALGKRDLDCALVRVRAYLKEVPLGLGKFQVGGMSFQPGTEWSEKSEMKDTSDEYAAIVFDNKGRQTNYMDGKINYIAYEISYIGLDKPPDSQCIDRALYTLELYEENSRALPGIESKIGVIHLDEWNWRNSDWYQLGLDDLSVASRILQQFHFIPEAQKPVAEKLADLRAAARSVADLISKSPSVHDSYFVGGTPDEYANELGENPSIFSYKIAWGCFWQDKPEDCIAMYRELMNSPNFTNIIGGLLSRGLESPRLVAWNEEDLKRIPMIWEDFVQELNASTNIMTQMAGRAFTFRNASGEEDAAAGWAAQEPERQKMEAERQKIEADKVNLQAFERQKQFLKDNKPFDPNKFFFMFTDGFNDYSKTQALEIQPLLAAYKTNLTGVWAWAGKTDVGRVEANVNRILNPPAPQPQSQPTLQTPKITIVAKPVAPVPIATAAQEVVTNVVVVSNFLAIPMDSLTRLSSHERIETSRVDLEAHHWFEGKLLLDFSYYVYINVFDDNGVHVDNRVATGDAIAMLDPATEHWKIIEVDSRNTFNSRELSLAIDPSISIFYHRSVLLADKLFNCDGGQIKRYDFQEQQWQVLPVSDGNNYELFAIDGHLYAANGVIIFEILDGWKSTRILASTRRNPPVSTLDRKGLGTPILFTGANRLLHAYVENTIYYWDQNDWHQESEVPSNVRPEVFDDSILFRNLYVNSPNYTDSLFCLETKTATPELCLWQQFRYANDGHNYFPVENAIHSPESLWKMPQPLSFAILPDALRKLDLYLLVDHSEVRGNITSKDGYNAALLCFSRDFSLPQKVFLKFDAPDSKTPTWMFPTTNLLLFGNSTGVWIIPFSQLDSAIAMQKQIQLAQQAKIVVATEQARKSLLAKYDLNHNNIIDPNEKETALDDPAFIESELDVMDANHNGRLDADELVYFDANKNKILEPKEQAGIDIAQHLLAARLMKQFDANGDGVLDRSEFNDLWQSGSFKTNAPVARNFPLTRNATTPFPDDNRDGKIDSGELETFLKQQTRSGLRLRGTPGAALMNQIPVDPSKPIDARQLFKLTVESYWKNQGDKVQ